MDHPLRMRSNVLSPGWMSIAAVRADHVDKQEIGLVGADRHETTHRSFNQLVSNFATLGSNGASLP